MRSLSSFARSQLTFHHELIQELDALDRLSQVDDSGSSGDGGLDVGEVDDGTGESRKEKSEVQQGRESKSLGTSSLTIWSAEEG